MLLFFDIHFYTTIKYVTLFLQFGFQFIFFQIIIIHRNSSCFVVKISFCANHVVISLNNEEIGKTQCI